MMFRNLFYYLFALLLCSCGISKSIKHKPEISKYDYKIPKVIKHSDSLFTTKNNSLLQNKFGQWELYVSGNPMEIGLNTGALYEPLYHYQEEVFFEKVEELVPSKFKQNMLRQFLKWYNRKMYLHIPEEYKTEIYGISQYASDKYNYIAPKYLRNLYLHGAHDIGHAMQDLALVGCSSLALWGNYTQDGKLLLGRNFDFYAGDKFAENKIIAFVKPTQGYPFASVTWAGMAGVVSGMNTAGLTITLNAGKSDIPLAAKTPISIVAREILQYAETIEQAIAIAKKRAVFVSEALMVSSAKDKKAVLIEVSSDNFGVFEMANKLICTNHFRSKAYAEDENNKKHIIESHSQYRFDKIEEILRKNPVMNPQKIADLLRNKEGLADQKIGYGNEKALNQLLAHHAVIFQPEDLLIWVSSNPYQLGEFVAYDLQEIFSNKKKILTSQHIKKLNIAKDDFLDSVQYLDYELFRKKDRRVTKAILGEINLSPAAIQHYQNLNPEYWKVYSNIGRYYFEKGYYKAAQIEFNKALTKEITTLPDRETIERYLHKIDRKLR
ncbi:putative choloylglycine hydrolase [Mesonia hippocampi]|uniref:Putative choloylglycine hydrolase n=1 Tax=Mesonia hippocampi TaxID=1628250 RepID=A0A840ERL4_9FLAO|nr:putative choloylglycine hydrolase [Mesonia hippocampi]